MRISFERGVTNACRGGRLAELMVGLFPNKMASHRLPTRSHIDQQKLLSLSLSFSKDDGSASSSRVIGPITSRDDTYTAAGLNIPVLLPGWIWTRDEVVGNLNRPLKVTTIITDTVLLSLDIDYFLVRK